MPSGKIMRAHLSPCWWKCWLGSRDIVDARKYDPHNDSDNNKLLEAILLGANHKTYDDDLICNGLSPKQWPTDTSARYELVLIWFRYVNLNCNILRISLLMIDAGNSLDDRLSFGLGFFFGWPPLLSLILGGFLFWSRFYLGLLSVSTSLCVACFLCLHAFTKECLELIYSTVYIVLLFLF
jgi:hypothetical protein